MIKIRNLPLVVAVVIISLLIIIVINPMPVQAESMSVPVYISVMTSDVADMIVDEIPPKTVDDTNISVYGIAVFLSVISGIYIFGKMKEVQ